MRVCETTQHSTAQHRNSISILVGIMMAAGYSNAAVGLTSVNGRTNHPVLFVPDFGQTMAQTWGAIPPMPSGNSCSITPNQVYWDITDNNEDGCGTFEGCEVKVGVSATAYMNDCAGVRHQVFPTTSNSPLVIKSAWYDCENITDFGNRYDKCGTPFADNSTVSYDPNTQKFTVQGNSYYPNTVVTLEMNSLDKADFNASVNQFIISHAGGSSLGDGNAVYSYEQKKSWNA